MKKPIDEVEIPDEVESSEEVGSPDARTYRPPVSAKRGLGPNSAGQSGDTQGLSDVEEATSESVEELVEEGQFYEAEVVSGIENAADADVAEVHTKQVREDDVPPEYQEEDERDTK